MTSESPQKAGCDWSASDRPCVGKRTGIVVLRRNCEQTYKTPWSYCRISQKHYRELKWSLQSESPFEPRGMHGIAKNKRAWEEREVCGCGSFWTPCWSPDGGVTAVPRKAVAPSDPSPVSLQWILVSSDTHAGVREKVLGCWGRVTVSHVVGGT